MLFHCTHSSRNSGRWCVIAKASVIRARHRSLASATGTGEEMPHPVHFFYVIISRFPLPSSSLSIFSYSPGGLPWRGAKWPGRERFRTFTTEKNSPDARHWNLPYL